MANAKQVVREFCALMAKRDAELLRPYLAEGAVYQNTGMPATAGVAAEIGRASCRERVLFRV